MKNKIVKGTPRNRTSTLPHRQHSNNLQAIRKCLQEENVPIQVIAYPYSNELIRGFTINSITLSVIRILEPSFAVKESFAYRYHERFLFKIMFKSLLTENFRY